MLGVLGGYPGKTRKGNMVALGNSTPGRPRLQMRRTRRWRLRRQRQLRRQRCRCCSLRRPRQKLRPLQQQQRLLLRPAITINADFCATISRHNRY